MGDSRIAHLKKKKTSKMKSSSFGAIMKEYNDDTGNTFKIFITQHWWILRCDRCKFS